MKTFMMEFEIEKHWAENINVVQFERYVIHLYMYYYIAARVGPPLALCIVSKS